MTAAHWQKVHRVDFRKLRDARLQAHYAAQWLARAARGCVPPRPLDGHTSLGWDDGFRGLTTHALPGGARLGLRIADLTLAILGGAPATLSLDGRADPEVRTWLGGALTAHGLDAAALDAPSPYDIPAHVIAVGARYSTDELIEPLRALAIWYADANGMLEKIRQKLLTRHVKAPPVRCWPHHFDLDTLVSLGRGRGIGAGFSPGDEYCDEPYFYLTIYPEPAIPTLPLLPPVGHWHSHEFLAAFAPAHKIVAAADQPAAVEHFFDVAIEAAFTALR
jgi:hypothetical protein